MADEKKTVKENPGKGSKFVAFFKNLPQNIATPFKNMWHELKKVTWPTKQDLIKYSCIVLLFMVFMGIVIGLLDLGSSRLVTAISSLKGTEEQIIVDTSEATPEEVTEAVTEAAEGAAEAVTDAAENAGEAVTDAVEEVKDAAEGAAEEVKETVEEAKDAAEEAAEAVTEAAQDAAEEVKEAVEDTAETAQDADEGK